MRVSGAKHLFALRADSIDSSCELLDEVLMDGSLSRQKDCCWQHRMTILRIMMPAHRIAGA